MKVLRSVNRADRVQPGVAGVVGAQRSLTLLSGLHTVPTYGIRSSPDGNHRTENGLKCEAVHGFRGAVDRK
jgi:hypothetical protein